MPTPLIDTETMGESESLNKIAQVIIIWLRVEISGISMCVYV
jgi:hypothetical protein